MASAAVHQPQGHSTSFEPVSAKVQTASSTPTKPHHVNTSLNYHKDPADGSEPAPSYVGKPESYERPVEPLDVTVHDVRGEEHKYSLDSTGFQIYGHKSAEKDFIDDAQIKAVYYPETEQLLKDAYVDLASTSGGMLTLTGPEHLVSSSSIIPFAAHKKTSVRLLLLSAAP